MPTRSKLQLDEQSFQGLLAAAYTIQQHADLLKPVSKTSRETSPELDAQAPGMCNHCGAVLKEDETRCGQCGEGEEEARPQERAENLFPSPSGLLEEDSDGLNPNESAAGLAVASPSAGVLQLESNCETSGQIEAEPPAHPDAVDSLMASVNLSGNPQESFSELRQLLIHHRANLYLGVSVLLAFIALLWPSAAPHQKPRLDVWQRVLVTLGIAEAPPPQIHYQGDPNIQVWVDPHTALYYCAGDELYGKAPGGHLTSQREAQMDQFEPANRAACN